MNPYPKHIKEEARELYSNGIRPRLIADKLGISSGTVSVWVRDLPKTNLVGAPIGNIPWNKGKHFIQMIGNKHAVSKGKIKENSSRYRARQILKKIDPCEHCGLKKKDSNMVIHHIDENVFNNDMSNLMRLCRSCHIEVHRKQLQASRKKI